jgi:riboflavin synthase
MEKYRGAVAMFTGLIETTGMISEVRRLNQSFKIGIKAQRDDFDVSVGASVAINGVCLTVESIVGKTMFFTAVHETLQRTTFVKARPGDMVNLERALLASGRLDGHFVLGHVDTVGTIIADRRMGESIVRSLRASSSMGKFIAHKGSVAIDGISLTIAECREETFDISLIPRTLETTTMGLKKAGDEVNIECDVLARYIQRLIGAATSSGELAHCHEGLAKGSLLDQLEGAGF